jgi:hypothetical protein
MIEADCVKYRTAIAETLYPFDATLFEMLNHINQKDEFYSTLILIYTKDEVYSGVNKAMRKASASKAPSGDDMLLSLY